MMMMMMMMMGVVAALQRCPTPRLLAGVRLRGMSIVPICKLFLQFSLLKSL